MTVAPDSVLTEMVTSSPFNAQSGVMAASANAGAVLSTVTVTEAASPALPSASVAEIEIM